MSPRNKLQLSQIFAYLLIYTSQLLIEETLRASPRSFLGFALLHRIIHRSFGFTRNRVIWNAKRWTDSCKIVTWNGRKYCYSTQGINCSASTLHASSIVLWMEKWGEASNRSDNADFAICACVSAQILLLSARR